MPNIDLTQLLNTDIDYLIVGGGTCGLVVAARLSEDPNVVVAVIEAGEHHRGVPEVDIPGLVGRGFGNPKLDWGFTSVPQKHANNRVTYQPRGKGLGGSSSLNMMTYSRASKADFDALERLGNKGWNWENMVKYMKKSETFVPVKDEALAKEYLTAPDPEVHGTDGPIVASFSKWVSPLHTTVVESLERRGLSINREPSNGVNVGITTSTDTINPSTAKRSYSASAYYEPNAARSNLLVVTSASVSKIVMEKAASGEQRAVGADIVSGGKVFEVRNIRKEVILAAGCFQTPPLLELSGIGNPKLLESLGITPLIDLPGVGENLQDHTLNFTVKEVDSTLDSMDNLVDSEEHIELYKHQKGIRATGPALLVGNLPGSAIGDEATLQRWQADATGEATHSIPSLKKQYNILRPWISDPREAQVEMICFPKHFFSPLATPEPGKRYYSFVFALMHPLSRGSVHITSKDPAAQPAIDPGYLTHPVDREMQRAALKFVLDMYETEPLKQAVRAPVLPPAKVLAAGDAALDEYIKETLGAEFHVLGSASMLPRADGGVVDAELKVYGTTNLRVVDCSILPLEISAHLQSAAYGIAEKGADIIKHAA